MADRWELLMAVSREEEGTSTRKHTVRTPPPENTYFIHLQSTPSPRKNPKIWLLQWNQNSILKSIIMLPFRQFLLNLFNCWKLCEAPQFILTFAKGEGQAVLHHENQKIYIPIFNPNIQICGIYNNVICNSSHNNTQ